MQRSPRLAAPRTDTLRRRGSPDTQFEHGVRRTCTVRCGPAGPLGRARSGPMAADADGRRLRRGGSYSPLAPVSSTPAPTPALRRTDGVATWVASLHLARPGAITVDSVVIGANPPGTIPPGCYSSGGAMNVTATTTVTLNGPGVYIFRPGGALTPAPIPRHPGRRRLGRGRVLGPGRRRDARGERGAVADPDVRREHPRCRGHQPRAFRPPVGQGPGLRRNGHGGCEHDHRSDLRAAVAAARASRRCRNGR